MLPAITVSPTPSLTLKAPFAAVNVPSSASTVKLPFAEPKVLSLPFTAKSPSIVVVSATGSRLIPATFALVVVKSPDNSLRSAPTVFKLYF